MEKKVLSKVISQLDHAWRRHDLAILDNKYRVCLVWYKGEYDAHSHNADEFFLVLQGEIEFRFRTRTIKLRKGESYMIKQGRPHVSRSKLGAHVLVVEAKNLSTKDVKNLAGLTR